MATFTFEKQRVIIRSFHVRGMKPIEIHQQLTETCNDGVIDVKNVRSCVRQFKEGRTSSENKRKEPPPCTSRSEDMIALVEQMFMEDCRLTVRQITTNAGISVGSVHTILHDDLKLRKVSARWVPRGGGSFGLFSHDVRPSVNCCTHERTFFTSIMPSLHVSLNCS
jgi:histone-lysine N-methyltransferase SETMAR